MNSKLLRMLLSKVGTAPLRLSALAAVLVLFAAPSDMRASDWIYRRSYHTHDVPPEESGFQSFPQSRSAYRRAYVNTTPGFAVRGGYRYNRILMRDGASTDLTVIRENWFQERP